MSRADFLAFRRSLGRTPPLDRMTARVRGLDIAVWTSPPVEGALPLLLVNGGMLYDHALLWPALSPLASARQVILYDQRGRGASQAPSDPLAARIEDDAADVGALRRALGIRHWDVLGHSWGGGIAMLGVVRDLAGTRRLVTVNAVGPTERVDGDAARRTAGARGRRRAARVLEQLGGAPQHAARPGGARRLQPRRAIAAWFADPAMAAYFAPPHAASVTGAAVVAHLRREGYDWRNELRALSVPTLVIHGERDALPAAVAHELCELLPRARPALLPDAGHMPFWEAPMRFFDAVGSFLAAPSTGPPRRRR